jgi:hypothetical protein
MSAYMEGESEIQAELEAMTWTNGQTFTHEVRQLDICLELNWPGVVVPKHTEYGKTLAWYALWARQTGIMAKIMSMYSTRQQRTVGEEDSEGRSLESLVEVFIAYGIMVVVSTVVFVGELVWAARSSNKKVNVDSLIRRNTST